MFKKLTLAALLIIGFAIPVFSTENKTKATREIAAADSDGDIDCSRDDLGQQLMNFCAMKSATKAKNALARARTEAQKRILKTSDDYNKDFVSNQYLKAFQKSSRAFHAFIQAQCELEGYMEAGEGTLGPLIAGGCMQRAYKERIKFMQSIENWVQ